MLFLENTTSKLPKKKYENTQKIQKYENEHKWRTALYPNIILVLTAYEIIKAGQTAEYENIHFNGDAWLG